MLYPKIVLIPYFMKVRGCFGNSMCAGFIKVKTMHEELCFYFKEESEI